MSVMLLLDPPNPVEEPITKMYSWNEWQLKIPSRA